MFPPLGGRGGRTLPVNRRNAVNLYEDAFDERASRHHHPGRAVIAKEFSEYPIDLRPISNIGDEDTGFYNLRNATTRSLENSVNVLQALEHLFFHGGADNLTLAVKRQLA